MEVPSGALSAVKEGAVWLIAAAAVFLGVLYWSDINSLMAPSGMRMSTEESAPMHAKVVLPAPAESSSDGPSEAPAGEGTSEAAPPEAAPAEPSSEPAALDRSVRIEAQSNGHFVTEAMINDKAVEVVVDTGATGVALTYEDAEAMGISLSDADFTGVSQTANGESRIARVKLDEIRIGDVSVRDVDAFVAEPGKLFGTLLGMTFLKRLGHVDMRGNELILSQ